MSDKSLVDGLNRVEHSLNIMGGEGANQLVVVNWFRQQHRTMQQCFMRVVIVPILQHLAAQYKAGLTDGRNVDSGRLAAKMLDAVTDDDLYIPFV